MRNRLKNVIILWFVFLLLFGLTGCSHSLNETSSDTVFAKTIEEKLNNTTNPKDSNILLSSNPYDYIKSKEGNDDYRYIVSQGKKSLNYMIGKFSESNTNGLKQYIMAIACSEILNEKPGSVSWSSGREWYNNYLMQKK
jgi:hypothetical protein